MNDGVSRRSLPFACGLFLAAACRGPDPHQTRISALKIGFDLKQLDARGLRGRGDGKVVLAYEFKIPAEPKFRRRVAMIDPSVRFLKGSRGRIGAGPHELLCIGSTHQPDHRGILLQLARLPFIERIIECHFE
jgi:hypothetical protein